MVKRMPPTIRDLMERVSASAGNVPMETVVNVVIAWEFNCACFTNPGIRRAAIDELHQ
jgi:hypothetical protein